jgi:hypothetical protein
VAAALAEAPGPESALSKSTVARICQAIKDEFDAWKLGDLSGIELEYLFCEGSHFQMRARQRAHAFADNYPRSSRRGRVHGGHPASSPSAVSA